MKRSAGLPPARPLRDTAETFGTVGQPATEIGNATVTTFPFCPVLEARRVPPGGAHVAASAAFGPPNSVTTSAVWGTSGSAGKVTVWALRSTVPTSFSATGGGNWSVSVGVNGDAPVR